MAEEPAARVGDPPPARVALVTGGSRGIGRAIAEGLAAEGLRVGLLARDRAALAQVTQTIGDAGGIAAHAAADVRDADQVSHAVGHLTEKLGPVDLLVNNAGMIDAEVPIWEADPAQWARVLEVNLLGVAHLMRVVLADMVARGGGRTVEIASGAGVRDGEAASAYSVTKTGLIRLSGHVHAAGYHRGLRSFAVAPGVVETSMTRGMRLHAGRTEFTSVELTVDLMCAIARGEIDQWSGRYLRVTHDNAAALRKYGQPAGSSRRLGIIPWGPGDPLSQGR